MALLPVTAIDRTGFTDASGTAATATTGDTFPNNGKTLLVIKNASVSALTASVTIRRTVDGVTPAAKTISVPASSTVIAGPFAPADYNDGQGLVTVICSAVASVTLKAGTVTDLNP